MKKQATSKVTKGEEQNRRINWLLHLLVLISIAAILSVVWSFLKNPEYFPLKTVRIDGEYPHVSRERLAEIITPNIQTGFFNLDLGKISAELKRLPWIEDVSIRRLWSDTLVIHITERQAFAYWNESSLLTSNGVVFTPDNLSGLSDLPYFNGPHGQQKLMLEEYTTLQQNLNGVDLTIHKIALSPRHAWTVILNNGVEIILGREQIGKRISRFTRSYPKLVAQNDQFSYVDLRYTNGFTLDNL